ncbi:hypothetical protein ACIQ1J_13870 [Streptomyces sp. NPDC097107]
MNGQTISPSMMALMRKCVHRVVGAGSKVRIAVRSAYTRAA